MATPEKGKSRVKNLEKALATLPDNLKKNKKDDFSKTISGLQDLLKQGISESELLGGDKGKSLVLNIRKCEIFEKLPKEFRQSILAFNIEEQKLADKKQDVKNPSTPSSPKCSRTENQSVDVGSAPVPTPSSQSPSTSKQRHGKGAETENHQEKIQLPSTTNKQRPGKEAETENHQEKIQKLQKELEEEREKAAELLHKFDDRGKQIQGLENDVEEKDKKIKFLDEESKHLAQSLLDQEKKIRRNVENDLKSARDSASRLEGQLNGAFVENEKHQKRIKELEAACKNLEASYKDLEKQKFHIEQKANKNMDHMQDILKEEKRKSDDQYKKLLAERDDLRDRFSKLAGKKLQEQNADIADLSDPNRAMKLSERFGQLYDDEWTNAFESLTDKKLGVPLKDAINVLLRLLQECWTFCNNLMATQMGSLTNVFLHPVQNMANFDQKKTGLTDRPRIASKDQLSLQDLRKRVGVSPSVIEEVKQALLADSKTWDKREKKEFDRKHIEACTPYIQKCAEICWLMALHDPPLLMKMDVKQSEKFDTNIYTVYSQSGQSIDFLVWPPLYNGKDGGLLSKGVAEPIKVVSKKK